MVEQQKYSHHFFSDGVRQEYEFIDKYGRLSRNPIYPLTHCQLCHWVFGKKYRNNPPPPPPKKISFCYSLYRCQMCCTGCPAVYWR